MKRPLHPLAKDSGLFDDDLYLSSNPGIQDALRDGVYASPLDYFCLFGYFQLVTRNTFLHTLPYQVGGHRYDYDESGYLRGNADVRALIAEGRYRTGLEHFLGEGHREICAGARRPSPGHEPVTLTHDLPGEVRPGARAHACVYFHDEPEGPVDPVNVESVRCLATLGVDVWFMTTASRLDSLSTVLPHVAGVWVTSGPGHDHHSRAFALRQLTAERLAEYELLLLVNDTTFFPVADPSAMFGEMRRRGMSFWSITDSYKTRYHLDHDFLALDARAREVVVPEFLRRAERNRYLNRSSEFIEYEIGLTEYAISRHIPAGAYCGCDRLRALPLTGGVHAREEDFADCDPSSHFWDRLITYLGCPTLRRDLLLANPLRVPYVDHWHELIDPSCLPAEAIQSYIDRCGPSEPQTPSRYRRRDFVPRLQDPVDGTRTASPIWCVIDLPARRPSREELTTWKENTELARHYGISGLCLRIDPTSLPDAESFASLTSGDVGIPFCFGFTALPDAKVLAACASLAECRSCLRVSGLPLAVLLTAQPHSSSLADSHAFSWATLRDDDNGTEATSTGDILFERIQIGHHDAELRHAYAHDLHLAAHTVASCRDGQVAFVLLDSWNDGLEPDPRFGYRHLHIAASCIVNHWRPDPDVEREIAASQASFSPRHSVAVFCHLFYEDLLPELAEICRASALEADFFFSVKNTIAPATVRAIRDAFPGVFLLRVDNHGRDVLPFFRLLEAAKAFGYRIGCKLHTKKSLHITEGTDWRTRLFGGLLGSRDRIRAVMERFEDRSVGMVAPITTIADDSMPHSNVNNRVWLDRLLPQLGRADLIGTYAWKFPAGTMFWFRLEAMSTLDELALSTCDFELEEGQFDGTLAHALERLFPLIGARKGFRLDTPAGDVNPYATTGRVIPVGSQWLAICQAVVHRVLDEGIENILVYGAGEVGHAFAASARDQGLTVGCIIDRNEALWGATVYGTPVCSFDQALALGIDSYFIASFAYAEEIEQLIRERYAALDRVPRVVTGYAAP